MYDRVQYSFSKIFLEICKQKILDTSGLKQILTNSGRPKSFTTFCQHIIIRNTCLENKCSHPMENWQVCDFINNHNIITKDNLQL